MSVWLDTRGKTTLAVGLCGRCSRKMSLDDLYDDPNSPGLKVCRADRDEFDPYRLPARQPDKITLRFTRPDTPIGTDPYGFPSEDDNYFLIDENGGYLAP